MNLRPRDIAERLAQRVEDVCELLLPNGIRKGAEWTVGSVEGEAGESCKIRLSGSKAGLWSDFATGHKGDLLDLWAAVCGVGIGVALRQVRDYPGLPPEQRFEGHRPRQYQRPVKPQCRRPSGPVLDYLTCERQLSSETLAAYCVAESEDGRAVIFPFLRDDKLVMCKRLVLERRDGRKDIRPTSAGQEPCLYGWQAIPLGARSVVLTESEIDAMSMYQYNFPALSVPFGGGKGAKQAWIENEFPHLERFDEILLALDQDAEGEAAAQEIADRLGHHRCRRVRLPYKDVNECLQLGIKPEVISQAITKAEGCDPKELRSASTYVDDVIRAFYPPDNDPSVTGFQPPWDKAKGMLQFRPSELTVVSGVNGHGKSEIVTQLALDAMAQGQRVCFASMEMPARTLLMRLTKQASGLTSDLPSIPYIRSIHDWYADKAWLFDVVGNTAVERMLEVFTYAQQRYGVSVFVVDSLMKCGIREDDYPGQKAFVDQLCDFKHKHDAHVFLVTHSRKGDSENHPCGKFDVKGSGGITDLADTVLTTWRNKGKEKQVAEAVQVGAIPSGELLTKPDALLVCSKQRNGEWEGQIALWWHQQSHQFVAKPGGHPHQYVPYSGGVSDAGEAA